MNSFDRIIFKLKSITAIVQNTDDYNLFIQRFYFRKNRILIIRGSGIDLKYYKKTNEPKGKNITLGFVGRMLEDKGIHWLVAGFKMALQEKKRERQTPQLHTVNQKIRLNESPSVTRFSSNC